MASAKGVQMLHRTQKFRELVRRWDWLLIVIIAPAVLFPNAGQAWALLALLLVLVVQALAWGEQLPVTPLNPAMLLLIIMVGVSTFVTPDLANSLGKIAGLLYGITVYFCVVRHTQTKQGWRSSLVLFVFTGVGIALLGVGGTSWDTTKNFGLNPVTTRLPVRLEGLPGIETGINPNVLAGTLLWILPVIFFAGLALVHESDWFFSSARRSKVRLSHFSAWAILLLISFILIFGVLVLTQSRGGYLALALSSLVLMVLVPMWPRRWWIIGVVAAIAISGLILIQENGWKSIQDQVIDILPTDISAFSMNSLNMRREIWSRAIWEIKDVPLTGLGMNVFPNATNLLYPTFIVSGGSKVGHAHSELLQAAVELGLPGLVGFIAVYVGALGMLFRSINYGGAHRLLALGLFGGLLAHFIFGTIDAVILEAKPGFLFWWLLGMAFGLYAQCHEIKETEQ